MVDHRRKRGRFSASGRTCNENQSARNGTDILQRGGKVQFIEKEIVAGKNRADGESGTVQAGEEIQTEPDRTPECEGGVESPLCVVFPFTVLPDDAETERIYFL